MRPTEVCSFKLAALRFRVHALRWTIDKEGVSLTKPVTVIIRTITVLSRRSGNAVTQTGKPPDSGSRSLKIGGHGLAIVGEIAVGRERKVVGSKGLREDQ